MERNSLAKFFKIRLYSIVYALRFANVNPMPCLVLKTKD